MTHPILWAGLTAAAVSVPSLARAQTCQTDVGRCAQLVTAAGATLEPSGLVWAADLGLAVGVHDERTAHTGYEIFAFDPSSVSAGKIVATPLFSQSQSDAMQLDDLEGLTRAENGVFFAFTSLSLDKDDNSPEDRWSRFQAVRFRVVKTGNAPAVVDVERLSDLRRPDLREWFISSSDRSWANESYRARAEKGGINVEGLAVTLSGNLVVGFRGPTASGSKALIAEFAPPRSDEAPSAPTWREMDLSGLPGSGSVKDRGVRAIERVPGEESWYVVVVGHTGGNYDRLRVGLWNASTGMYFDRFELPDRFVGEGVAVTSATETKLTLLVVSDLNGYVMELEIDR